MHKEPGFGPRPVQQLLDGLAAAVFSRRDPEAILRSFATDHMINGGTMRS